MTTTTHNLTAAESLAAIAAIQAANPDQRGEVEASDGPPDPWMPSERDGDHAAAVDEGFTERTLRWFR